MTELTGKKLDDHLIEQHSQMEDAVGNMCTAVMDGYINQLEYKSDTRQITVYSSSGAVYRISMQQIN